MRVEVFPDIAISTRNVTLSFGTGDTRTDVLKGIDLEIRNGETIAILGPSGSGKSSLMAVLSGLERVSGGQVHVAGTDFGPLDDTTSDKVLFAMVSDPDGNAVTIVQRR